MRSTKSDIVSLPGPDEITRVTLPNGITVLVRENRSSPAVVIDGTLRAGSIDEGRRLAGLSNFTASALMHGSDGYSFDQIHECIESAGANLHTSSGMHTAGFSGKCLAEDLDLLLNVASDVMRRPEFPEEHVERLRGQILTALSVRNHDTRAMAALAFYEELYGPDHPYGYANSGYPDTIRAIRRSDIVDFHNHHYGPRDMFIVIVGSVDPQEALALVDKHFGDWNNSSQGHRSSSPHAARPKTGLSRQVTISGKTQSDIVIGWLGPRRNDPDYQVVRLANSVLGVFGMYGRLGDKVRNKLGLAYYSFSRVDGSFGPGTWRMSAGVNPDNIEAAKDAMLREAERMVSQKVRSSELDDNKSYLLGSLPIHLETNEGVASSIVNMELYNLGLDYLQCLAGQIRGITQEQILVTARKYIDPERFVLSVAGPS